MRSPAVCSSRWHKRRHFISFSLLLTFFWHRSFLFFFSLLSSLVTAVFYSEYFCLKMSSQSARRWNLSGVHSSSFYALIVFICTRHLYTLFGVFFFLKFNVTFRPEEKGWLWFRTDGRRRVMRAEVKGGPDDFCFSTWRSRLAFHLGASPLRPYMTMWETTVWSETGENYTRLDPLPPVVEKRAAT